MMRWMMWISSSHWYFPKSDESIQFKICQNQGHTDKIQLVHGWCGGQSAPVVYQTGNCNPAYSYSNNGMSVPASSIEQPGSPFPGGSFSSIAPVWPAFRPFPFFCLQMHLAFLFSSQYASYCVCAVVIRKNVVRSKVCFLFNAPQQSLL